MSPTARIILNTGASYGRSMLALALGLFSSRWVLAALGKDDLGLFGLVGSIIFLIGMLNGILSSAVSRYYAYSVGNAKKHPGKDGLDDGIRWFNTALFIHTTLPLMLVAIGYPIGLYAFQHWLVVPIDRMGACLWVFRLALASAFLNMVSVPYTAMFTAKQLIAEVTVFQMLQAVATFVCAYFLASWSGDRLIAYAFYVTLIPIAVTTALVVRAHYLFPECVVKPCYLFQAEKLKKLFAFASGDLFGWLGGAVRDQGVAFLINRNFGLGANAAYTISNQVSGHTMSLSNAMMGALMPAMTTAEGAGRHDATIAMAFRGIKFGVLAIALFSVPLAIEMDEVLRLWLVNPPPGTAIFCRFMLFAFICHKLGWGHHLAILAGGRVVLYQLVVGSISAAGVIVSAVAILMGFGLTGVAGSFVVIYMLMTIVRVLFARRLCCMPLRLWLVHVVLPIGIIIGLSLSSGLVVQCLLEASFVRVLVVGCVCGGMTLLLGYLILCDNVERTFLKMAVARFTTRLAGGSKGRGIYGGK